MTFLYITRHGETKWNLEGRFQGQQNSELTERGYRQANNLGQVIDEENIDLIISSPLRRARETAKAACGSRRIPIIILDSLKELSLGEWEGQKLNELKNSEAEQYHLFWNDPLRYKPRGGESFQAMIQRAGQGLTEILKLAQGKRVLVVTHGMTLKAILHHLTGKSFNEIISQPVLRQTSITKVRVSDIKAPIYQVDEIGGTKHLDSLSLHTEPVAVWEGQNND
jgi:probable phosphoglycerate mutase